MKFIILLLIIPVFAQDQAERKEQVKEQTLADLKLAEKKRLEEQQRLLTKQQHIESLLEELETNKKLILEKEEKILAELQKNQQKKEEEAPVEELQLPQELIDHYQSRDPEIAAKDFIELYEKTPKVCIALIRSMKKKKSAKLMDTVVKLDARNGTKIASEITAAIGEGD